MADGLQQIWSAAQITPEDELLRCKQYAMLISQKPMPDCRIPRNTKRPVSAVELPRQARAFSAGGRNRGDGRGARRVHACRRRHSSRRYRPPRARTGRRRRPLCHWRRPAHCCSIFSSSS